VYLPHKEFQKCVARFRRAKATETRVSSDRSSSLGWSKMHTLLDQCGNIPTFIHITDGKVADMNVLDVIFHEATRMM